MAASVRLDTMRTEVRRRADMTGSAWLTDAEVNTYLNYALAYLYNQIIEADSSQYYSSVAFVTAANVDTYALATVVPAGDFYKLRSVDISNGDRQISAKKFAEHERNLFKNYPYWATGWPVRYRLLGKGIKFVPQPQSQYTITLNYYPTYTPLVADSDTFDGCNGWEEYAIWKVVAYALGKDESDPSFALGQCAELLAAIRQQAATRDEGEPERAQDVYASTYGWVR